MGAVFKFGDVAVEKFDKVQFTAATGEEFGSAIGHVAEGAANPADSLTTQTVTTRPNEGGLGQAGEEQVTNPSNGQSEAKTDTPEEEAPDNGGFSNGQPEKFVSGDSNSALAEKVKAEEPLLVFPELEPPNFERGVPPKRLVDQNGLLDQKFTDPVAPRDTQNYDKNTSNNDPNTSLVEGGGSQGALPPWRDSNGDFIGEKGDKHSVRVMPASENPEEEAEKLHDNFAAWFKERGITIVDEEEINTAKEGEVEKILKRTKFSNGMYFVRRAFSSKKTPDSWYNFEINNHPDISGNLKFKFPRRVDK